MSAPLLQQTTPSDNASGVAVTANLALYFDEIVQLGTSGTIRIYKSDGTLVHTISATDASQVSLEAVSRPRKVIVNPNVDLQPGTGYYVLVDAGAVEARTGEDFAGISSSTTFNFTTAGTPLGGGDTTAPTLTGTTPADNATTVAVGANLVLTFNESVQAGSDNIEIRNANGTIAKTIAVTDGTQVSFAGNQLTINPTTDLTAGSGYYVTMSSGVVRDLANNNFAGISSQTTFNFTTAGGAPPDTTAPVWIGTFPANNSTGVSGHLVLVYHETVQAGSGVIEIRKVSDGSLVTSIDITDTTQVSFSGNRVTIDPTSSFPESTALYLVMTGGAVRDLAGNPAASISSSTEFTFTTGINPVSPPLLTGTTPTDNATEVPVNSNLVLTFNEAVKVSEGYVQIRRVSDDSIVTGINIIDETQVSFSGNQVTINPTADLPAGMALYVTMMGGAVRDLAGAGFEGISSPSTFNFSTTLLDLIGTPDDDTLNGSNRNELINGLTGVDTLLGGLGDDTYIIANQEGGENSLYIEREPGASDPGEIWSYILEPSDLTAQLFDFSGDGFVDFISFYFIYSGWSLSFSTTELDENIAPGTYDDAEYVNDPSPGHPGIAISGPQLGSTGAHGSFTITDAVFDYSGPTPVLVSFSVSFEQYSDSWGDQAYTGTFNYAYAPAGPATIDTITEYENEGIDTVRAAMSYTLGPNLENLTLTGFQTDYDGTGNELDNVIIGTYGNNVIDGGLGADTMVGTYGSDTYVVDDAGDIVTEVPDSASLNADVVKSSITFALGDYFEQLILTGSANINGTGNGLDNAITGNTGNNVLSGGLGLDSLLGGGGNDTFKILAGGGSDSIGDFSAGAGLGDSVVLDGFALGSFTAVHAAMTQVGANTVLNLGDGETLTFLNLLKSAFAADDFSFLNVQPSGPSPFTLPVSGAYTNTITGGRRADNLTGTAANNRIDGRQGSDTMTGLAGDDTYLVDASGDNVVEGLSNGIDTVISSASSYTLASNVENLTLTGTNTHTATGNGLDNLIIASNRPDIINGGAGNDIIRAGTGACVLTGSAGNDIFDFDVMGSQKQITDFTVGQDLVDLRTLLAWYGGSDPLAGGAISLSVVAGGVLVSVKASAGGSLQGLVKITGVSVGDLDIGADILWDA